MWSIEGGRRILIVEDDEVLAQLMASVLDEAGYRSDIAPFPEAACGAYDVVIADYLAPQYVPGEPWPHLEALRRLSRGGPIIGCTGHVSAADEPPERLGVQAVVAKPFDVDELVQRVQEALARREQSRV